MTYGSPRTHVVDLTDRQALQRWRPAAPDVVAEAERLKEAALLDFGLTESAVASWLYSKCRHQLATTAVDTAAVVASGDGTCLLLYNPDFFVGLGLDGVKFVLFHEARHLIQCHLFVEPELHTDPVFRLATEVTINHVALVRLGRAELPRLDGKPVGIDPQEIHRQYLADLGEQGLPTLDYSAFVGTDQSVYAELKRMRNPPVPTCLCPHLDGDGVPADQETIDEIGGSVLLSALLAARRGHRLAEQELLDLMHRTEGASERAGRLWGNLGAGLLRTSRPWRATTTYPTPPEGWTGASKLEAFIDAMIELGQTGQIFGEHGIGKTATFHSRIAEAYRDTQLVVVPAANLTPDDLLANAPIRDEASGRLVLRQLMMSQLKPGKPFVLLIDDSLQAGETIQSQLMQIACNWTLGEYDLRALGCVGVFLTDNESLAETSARRSDLAILDRMVTIRITANDTAWRIKLAARFPDWDLNPVFSVWASLPPTLRELLSPRTLEHVLANAREGFPLIWGLPLVNGERLRLAEPRPDGHPGPDRTHETLDRIATALGVPNPQRIADPVRCVVRAALANRWAVLLQGPPGCGKTELVRELTREALGREALYFSLPVTNVEDLCAPIPTPDGRLENLLAVNFTDPQPKAIVWDEYNRPKDKAAFAKLMEITQEWSIAGHPIEGLRAQIALQNPPYHLGRKLQVARNNIAQATRFTASLVVDPADIPANEWLIARYGQVAETVLEWWKNDLDEDGRAWITKRTLERLIKLHQRGLPLHMGTVYLGDGEYAPVSLTALTDRLADRKVTGLSEIAADLADWETRLRRAAAQSSEGGNDTDIVHQAVAKAELSQLRKHRKAVARLVMLLPPKLRSTYLVGASPEQQRYWMELFASLRTQTPVR